MSKIKGKSIKLSSPFDATSSKTERTANQKAVEWINQIIKEQSLPIGFSEQETVGADRKQPDIIIYKSPQSTDALCIIELKPPYFDPFDFKELKKPTWEKAVQRKAKYFGYSNFQKLILYKTEEVNRQVDESIQIAGIYDLSTIEDLNNIEEPRFKNAIIKGLEKFLFELVDRYTGKKPEHLLPIDEFLIIRLQEKNHRLARLYKPIIRDKFHKDSEFAKRLSRWFNEQQWSFAGQDNDYDKAARQTAYLLINKLLFYQALKAKHTNLLSLQIPDDLTASGQLQKTLQQVYFAYVTENIDYETIYSTDFIDQIAFPDNKNVVEEIKNLVKIIKEHDFSKIGFDIIGRIFEKLIPQEERHILGQYFTSPDVVDLILKFCLKHEDDKVIDPSCGAGTFLVRAYRHKKLMNNRLPHQEILETLWGVDIAKFPAHLATINLAINDLGVLKNYPNIAQEDFFNLLVNPDGGVELTEKWRKLKAKTLGSEQKEITHPRWFDCIVGNPPYTRQEEITEITEKAGYKENLIEKALFYGRQRLADISKRAGIHAYFFVHGTKFLKEGGRFGFIVSDSWLDADYGKGIQELFLKHYRITAIITSKVERWFEDADINTCIIILERCKAQEERNKNLVKFVYLLKPLRHFIPPAHDMWEKQKQRLDAIENLIKTISYHNDFYQNDELRIYPKKQSELWEEGFDAEEGKYTGSKWGKYLRAPEIFFKILKKGKDKLVPLKKMANIRRGFTTGVNEFFYLTEEEIEERGMEKEFWMHKDEKGNWLPNKVIVSPREAKKVVISTEDLSKIVLFINKDKSKLRNKKILNYIKHGERQGFHKRSTCSSRKLWYNMEYRKPWPILHPMIHHDRQTVVSNKSGVQVDHNLFEIRAKKKRNNLGILCFLLSTVSMLFKEFSGRVNLGEGALKTEGIDIEKLFISKEFPAAVLKSLRKLAKKYEDAPINSIFEELDAKYPDEVSLYKVKSARRELDKIIMGDILGLTEDEQLEVYRAIVDLVKSRIEKAKSVDKKGKTTEGVDVELLTKTIKEKLGDKLLGHFYREKILNQKNLKTVKLFHPTPLTSPLSKGGKRGVDIRKDFLGGSGWLLISGKDHIECQTEAEAEYLKLWLESGLEEVKVPKDETYISKILPELKALKEKIDRIISDHISSITSQKLQNKILQKLQGELF
ncbi:MAG: SAM-dependent DNA methyltransferase [Nitrospirae bacterium]|nr:SAM-dependent DNA methyltransferase [Nitrospirota bacterium]